MRPGKTITVGGAAEDSQPGGVNTAPGFERSPPKHTHTVDIKGQGRAENPSKRNHSKSEGKRTRRLIAMETSTGILAPPP